jgi:hypothetical protein
MQEPNTKQIPISKVQIPNTCLGNWILELIWNLSLGSWNFANINN